MKKVISLVLSTTLVAVLCTACGTSATSSSSAPSDQVSSSDAATAPAPGGTQEPIVLRVSWWGSQARTDGTVAALNAYTAENPHVTFEYEFSDWGAIGISFLLRLHPTRSPTLSSRTMPT